VRILLSAFACHPGRGSEPGVGWQLAVHLARDHEVWVLTDGRNRPGILSALNVESRVSLNFRFLRLPGGYPLVHHVHYFNWQLWACRIASELHHKVGFDLVHHVTYMTSWQPSFMGRLGAAFIWSAGPRETTPSAFLREVSPRSRRSEISRNVGLSTMGRITEWITGRSASVVLSSSPPWTWPRPLPVRYFPLGGLTEAELGTLATEGDGKGGRIRLASVGRLLGWKGFSLGLRAFARVHEKEPNTEYWIIGEGPERAFLERLASRLKVDHAVRFLGGRTREEVFRLLGEADVLVHPSFHEQFGYVMAEAMAAGRPVVCLDVGPAPALVPDECGRRISVTSPEAVVQGLTDALLALVQSPTKRRSMGEAGREWVRREWNWDSVTGRVVGVYQGAL